MKKILLGIVVMGILGSCANWEDTKKDWESSTEGLKRKVAVGNTKLLDIIACENMIEGSDFLKQEIFKYLSEEEQDFVNKYVGFPNSAVDRIVPAQKHDDVLLVEVEKFCEWVVEAEKIKVEDNKKIEDVRLVASGAGAASIACLNLLVSLGMKRENITVCDSKGVIYKNRDSSMDDTKKQYAIEDNGQRSLADAIPNADIFLGCSVAGALTQEMVKTMGPNPLILALANPNPEITPPEAKAVRPDAIICTGRSDFPNQVNNVLCFPFIFRGALDVGATAINEEMKMAAVYAIADLAMAEQNEVVTSAYGDGEVSFGPDYIIPKPFDPRLIVKIAPAVAKAAMDSGIATRPIEDFDAYIEKLTQFVYKTNLFMKPVFAQAKLDKKRVLLTDGEEPRVLHAVQEIATLGIALPVLIGRPSVIEQRVKSLGLHLRVGHDYEIIDIEGNEHHQECWTAYYELRKRNGISPATAQREMRTNPTVIGATLLHLGKIDAMVCGLMGSYASHLKIIKNVIGTKPGVSTLATVNGLVLPKGNLFITDTFVNQEPNVDELSDIRRMAA